ncbi:MAG: hypothetical protein GWN37_14160 [Gammaproteobacteria bacterium]|nr:hypothetical protein [Gammaproteobacteria bacterium]
MERIRESAYPVLCIAAAMPLMLWNRAWRGDSRSSDGDLAQRERLLLEPGA